MSKLKIKPIVYIVSIVMFYIGIIISGMGYKYNKEYRSRSAWAGDMRYMIDDKHIKNENSGFLRYEGDNQDVSTVLSFINNAMNSYYNNDSVMYDYFDIDKRFDVLDASSNYNHKHEMKKIEDRIKFNGSSIVYTVRATRYDSLGGISKITIVAHKKNEVPSRNIDLSVTKAP